MPGEHYVQGEANRQQRKGQRQDMRVHIGQQETEGRKLANGLEKRLAAVEINVGQHAAGAEPPPEVPVRQPTGNLLPDREYFRRETFMLAPEREPGIRAEASLPGQFDEWQLPVAE